MRSSQAAPAYRDRQHCIGSWSEQAVQAQRVKRQDVLDASSQGCAVGASRGRLTCRRLCAASLQDAHAHCYLPQVPRSVTASNQFARLTLDFSAFRHPERP